MIEAIPKGWLSKSFLLQSSNGEVVELDLSGWRERAEFEMQGVPHQLYRESALGDFVLDRGGTVIARATKASAFRERFELEVSGHLLTLQKLAAWRRGFGVYDGPELVGTIAPVNWYSHRATIELPEEWKLPLHVFLFWLVVLMWKRQAAAAAAG